MKNSVSAKRTGANIGTRFTLVRALAIPTLYTSTSLFRLHKGETLVAGKLTRVSGVLQVVFERTHDQTVHQLSGLRYSAWLSLKTPKNIVS
jgi:hypothetical protein